MLEPVQTNPQAPFPGASGIDSRITELVAFALRGLGPMFDPDTRLYCHTLQKTESGMVRQGVSPRYTIMTLLGLHRREAHRLLSPVDIRPVLEGVLRDAGVLNSIGDFGLLIWLCAEAAPDRLPELLSNTRVHTALERSREAREGRTMELAWLLTGISEAVLCRPGEFPDLERPAFAVYETLSNNQGKGGTFGHLSRDAGWRGALRGEIGSFADQVYPIYAFARFMQAFGDESAVKKARRCADAICRAQGPLGQWWWHYDARSGKVFEPYPVYSVHQHGMGPMALFALGEAANLDFTGPIYKGLQWIFGNNELACDLRDSSAGVIWRSFHHGSKAKLYRDRIRGMLGLGWPTDTEDLTIKYECRPYELGWLLYAFAGRASY